MNSVQNDFNADFAKKASSDVTLFNPKQGFFPNFVKQVTQSLSPQVLQKFALLKSDRDRLRTLWEIDVVHSITTHSLFTGKKGQISEERRQNGNEAFKDGENQKALTFYTQAVIRAPSEKGSTHLSIALANRSAVLYRMSEYATCLQDIDLSLEEGYPQNLQYKVVDRRGQCLWRLDRYKEAKKCYKQCIQLLKFSNLDEQKIAALTQDLKAKLQLHESNKGASNGTDDEESSQEPLYNGASKVMPKASSAMEMQYTKEAGRYITCSSTIPGGSVLFREEPFCSVLMPDKQGLCCCHCYKKLLAPVPCRTCSNTAFCSASCRSEADRSYHKYECQFAELFRGSGMSLNCFLSLRAVTERGLKKVKNASLPTSEEPALIPSEESPYDGRNINNILRLVALEDQRDHMDFLQRTLMAIFLLKVLKKADFFARKEKEGRPLLEDHIVVGCILLRLLQVVQFNSHELSAVSYQGELHFKNTKSVFIGLALYPTVSFLNHSCFPAVSRYFNGREMCIVTLRPLKKGEIVSENYGPIFTHLDKVERERKLKARYWFDCQCEACIQDWPKMDFIPEELKLSCPSCDSKLKKIKESGRKIVDNDGNRENMDKEEERCLKCGNNADVERVFEKLLEAHKEFDIGKTHMDNYRREDAIKSFLNYVEEVIPKCKLPIRDIHTSLQALRHLLFHRGKCAVFCSTR